MANIYSFSPFGYEGSLVSVEVDLRRGIPAVDVVGLADGAVKETGERVRAAVINSGFEFPSERVLISLSPADLKKEGAGFDLPVALGILNAKEDSRFIEENVLVMGELELSGRVRAVKGIHAACSTAFASGIQYVVVPKENYEEAARLFQRLEDQGNDSYALHNYLGQSYWQTGILYRAKQELTAAWQIDSSDVSLAYSLAAINAESRSGPFLETVKPWLDKAIEMTRPDPILMSRIHQQYAGGFFRVPDLDQSIFHYKEAYRYNPKLTPLLQQIAYCYELKKDPKNALTWYEKYLSKATPGTQGYEFAAKSIELLKAELFMTEPAR